MYLRLGFYNYKIKPLGVGKRSSCFPFRPATFPEVACTFMCPVEVLWILCRTGAQILFIRYCAKPTELPDLKNVEIVVLTVDEVQSIWLASEWNQNNPNDGDLRRWQIPDEALAAWDKLPS